MLLLMNLMTNQVYSMLLTMNLMTNQVYSPSQSRWCCRLAPWSTLNDPALGQKLETNILPIYLGHDMQFGQTNIFCGVQIQPSMYAMWGHF